MTVVECFERSPLENIASYLSLKPDKLIFIGEGEDIQEKIDKYKEILPPISKNIKIERRKYSKKNIKSIIPILEEIVKTGEECVFDLWGGEELVLVAARIVYDRYKDIYPVTMQRVDVNTGKAEDCDGDGLVKKNTAPKITVKELIALCGGAVTSFNKSADKYSTVELDAIWNLVCKNPSEWNKKFSALSNIENEAGIKGDPMDVVIDFTAIKNGIQNYDEDRELFDEIIKDLSELGALKVKNRSESRFAYSYENVFLRHCIKKEGDVLEYKTLFEAREFMENNKPFFNDCMMGVNIDWDGVINSSVPGGKKDTKNEIDVMLIKGLIPVFISCKNGRIEEVELYKLNTVAQRFGGVYSKKVLIATNFEPGNEDTKQSLLQRAEDMGIIFEPDAATFDKNQWQQFFKKIIEN